MGWCRFQAGRQLGDPTPLQVPDPGGCCLETAFFEVSQPYHAIRKHVVEGNRKLHASIAIALWILIKNGFHNV
ncbi:MAG: hypothetical protein EOO85_07220 [Pedobacter sp.]|nr:MAG: hypothetical protein EOO85_07220 [Pedobacter sp.]